MDNAAQAVKDAGGNIVLNKEVVEFVTDAEGHRHRREVPGRHLLQGGHGRDLLHRRH